MPLPLTILPGIVGEPGSTTALLVFQTIPSTHSLISLPSLESPLGLYRLNKGIDILPFPPPEAVFRKLFYKYLTFKSEGIMTS